MSAVEAVMLVGAAVLAWRLRSVMMLLFAAVVGAVALDIPVAFICRKFQCLNRKCVVIGVTITSLVGFWILSVLLLPELVFQAGQVTAMGPRILNVTRREGLDWLMTLEEPLEPYFEKGRFANFVNMVKAKLEDPFLYSRMWAQLRPYVYRIFMNIGAHIFNVMKCVLVYVLAVLLCFKPQEHRQMLVNSLPAFYRRRAFQILDMCREELGALILGLGLSATCVGVLTWSCLLIYGAPLALVSGLLAGAVNFVPTVGPPIGVLFPTALALTVSACLTRRVLMLGVFIQYITKPILKALFVQNFVSVLPTTGLLAQAGFGLLLGFPGALLALPFLVVWQVVLREVLQRDIMDRWHGPDFTTEARSALLPSRVLNGVSQFRRCISLPLLYEPPGTDRSVDHEAITACRTQGASDRWKMPTEGHLGTCSVWQVPCRTSPHEPPPPSSPSESYGSRLLRLTG